MSKAVLIVEDPENCIDCKFCRELDEGVNACCELIYDENDLSLYKMIETRMGYCQQKPDWCPLKKMPEIQKYVEDFFNGDDKVWNEFLNFMEERVR